MRSDLTFKVSLSLLAYLAHKKKLDIPSSISGPESVEIIKKEVFVKGFWEVLCTDGSNDLREMAKALGAPESEYLDFCKTVHDELLNEMKYLHEPGSEHSKKVDEVFGLRCDPRAELI